MDITVIASGSKGNCYTISDGSTTLMLDCGIPFGEILEAMNFVFAIHGVLVTHEHQDHVKAAKQIMKRAVSVYTSSGTASAAGLSGHRLKTIKSMQQFSIGTFIVLPFEVEHDAREPLGYLIYSTETQEKLLYFTDTFYIKYRFKAVTHLMCECNYSAEIVKRNMLEGYLKPELVSRIYKSHMSLETLAQMLVGMDRSKLKEVRLLHLSDGNSDEKLFKSTVKEICGDIPVFAYGN